METLRESDEEMDSENEVLPYTYEGDRNENGERHGKGKARLPNGDIYEGQYKHGYRNGYGKYVFRKLKGKSRNACYMGHYENNKKNGQGTFLYPDGAKYEGSWRDDLRHGFGSYFYTNGDLYRGEWEYDRRHGQGTYTYAVSGMSYEGQWFEGKRSGRGKLTFGKQNYIGNFYDDKMIGPGTYIFPNGTQQHGEYIVVEEEIEEVNETGKGKNDNDTENRSRTKQVKIKWISKSGDTPPVTVVKKETLIN